MLCRKVEYSHKMNVNKEFGAVILCIFDFICVFVQSKVSTHWADLNRLQTNTHKIPPMQGKRRANRPYLLSAKVSVLEYLIFSLHFKVKNKFKQLSLRLALLFLISGDIKEDRQERIWQQAHFHIFTSLGRYLYLLSFRFISMQIGFYSTFQ